MSEVLEAPAVTETDPFADIQADDPFSDIPNEDDPFADIVSQSPTSESEKALAETPKSENWRRTQGDMAQRANDAGLPPTNDSRQRLIDAISRTEMAGFKTQHFIGLPNEPKGDRGVTRDIENLVTSLRQRETGAPFGPQRDAISKERAYWESEAASGMSADEWRKQTGEREPRYPEEPQSTLVELEKDLEKLTGIPVHQVMNATRVFGSAAGKYIFSGLQGLEIETAKVLKNPPSELTTPQAEAVLLPQEEQDALEQKYIADTQAAVPDALVRAEYWKQRAEGADEQSEVDPALAKTIPARLSAVAGEATMMGMEALVPGVGLPLMVMHGALATEAEALNHGQTPEQAEAAAVRSAIGLAIFGGASKVAALGVAKLLPKAITDPNKLTKFMAQFVGQEAANESSSRVIAAWNAASDAPPGEKVEHALQALKETTLEQSALNTAFALIGASKAAGARPKGVTKLESQYPAIASKLADERAVRPASKPEAVPVTESGMPAETQRYVEPAKPEVQSDPMFDPAKNPQGTVAAIEEIQRRNAPEPISPLPAEASTANAAAQAAGKADIPAEPKRSKIGQSIEAKAVEAKLTEGFAETALYDPITIADQAQRATGLVKSSINDARAVIRGEAPLPEGLRGTSLITAMEEHLSRKPDAQAAYELANSPLTSATSAAAQEMRLMSERVPDGITAKFQEIREARKAGSKQRGETSERVVQDIQREMVRNASKRPTWEAWVREITC